MPPRSVSAASFGSTAKPTPYVLAVVAAFRTYDKSPGTVIEKFPPESVVVSNTTSPLTSMTSRIDAAVVLASISACVQLSSKSTV